MNATGGEQSIEAILQLVLDGREGEALSAISVEFGKSTAEELRFYETALGSSGGKRDRFEKEREERRNRGRLANLYELSIFLMDKECWEKAVTALGWTIKLSEDMDEPYFLEDSRFRKASCHKILGQRIEMLKEKKKVSANKTFFIGDEVLGVRDLD
jgi:hypothetical protein